MNCPKCYSDEKVKNGIKYNKQRYKCKGCGCSFTQSHRNGASLETKLIALKLYLEGMGFRSIGRIMNVNNVTVLNWIRTMGASIKTYVRTHMPDDIRHVDVIEIDEMWHFRLKKSENYGYGSPSTDTRKRFSDFQWAVVARKSIKN